MKINVGPLSVEALGGVNIEQVADSITGVPYKVRQRMKQYDEAINQAK